MFAGHIKSAVTMRMRKKDGTLATTDEEKGRVLCDHFDGAFNAPATAQVNDDVLTGLSLLTFPKSLPQLHRRCLDAR